MPTADVVVVGAGLAGLSAGIVLAETGARVELVARGHAATHWTPGGFDCAAPPGAATPAAGIDLLATRVGHPYAILGGDVRPGLAFVREVVSAEGLAYRGDLDDPLRAVPTAIGGTRRVGVVPAGQGNALDPWSAGERLVVCGIAGYKDFWPAPIAASLARAGVWVEAGDGGRPARVDSVTVELPGQAGRRNLNALELGRSFDDPAWRREAFGRIARAVEASGRGPGRIAFPAVLGIGDHAAVLEDAARILPLPLFEVPLVTPSLPGLRLYRALRAGFRRRGGRMSIGEPVIRIETAAKRATTVVLSAAVRERRIGAGHVIIATGGIAGGGLIGRADGRLVEALLDLPVEAPPVDDWLADEALPADGHPLERAGIRTDANLHPINAAGKVAYENVLVVGSLLAGQRYLAERCG
ncbi:MAG TPA: FAD-binding protein, partial [Candidatus Limnocylindrales bacterium]|nr:FAD-binding protein [Candidatus Limnocylindrales bacterium]